MKKFFKSFLCLLFVLTMTLSSVAFAKEAVLEGTYLLDATPLGMPLTIYLTIDEGSNFQWTNKLTGGADKGHGKIGTSGDLYMMLYSDSTNENVKSATFTVDGNNLVFSTRVPYGTSGLNPNTEDAENTIYPVAQKMLYTDMLGEYVGSLAIEAMGSEIVYDVELSLGYGATYTLTSSFAMGGEVYDYVQEGLFSIENGQINLIAEGKPEQAGVVTEDGFTLNAILSQMSSSTREIVLKKAVTAEVAGVYTGVKDMSMMGFVANATLTLDKVGGFQYVSVIQDEDDFVQAGTFTVDGETITLFPEDSEPIACTLANDVLNAKMRINAAVPVATAIDFYRDNIQGVFTADGEDDTGAAYLSTLSLNADGSYLIVVAKNGKNVYQEKGTFETEASMMGVSLVLISDDGTTSVGVVDATINITHNIDAMFNTLGFKYVK